MLIFRLHSVESFRNRSEVETKAVCYRHWSLFLLAPPFVNVEFIQHYIVVVTACIVVVTDCTNNIFRSYKTSSSSVLYRYRLFIYYVLSTLK